MVTIGEANIEVGADAGNFGRDLDAETSRAARDAERAGTDAGRRFGLGFGRGSSAATKDSISTFGQLNFSLARLGGGFGTLTSSIVPLPSALGGVAAGAVAVAGAVGQASGAAVSLGGVMASLGLAAVTAQVASVGLTEAFEAQSKAQQELATTGAVSAATQEELDTALQSLAPSARGVVKAIAAITPAWSAMQNAVQQEFFQGIGASIRDVSGAVLPSLRSGLVETAGIVNGALQAFAGFAQSEQFVGQLDAILGGLNETLAALLPGLGQIGQGLLTVFEDSLGPAEGIARAFTDMATRFNGFIQSASDSGQLTTFFNDAVTVAGDLVGIIGDIGGVLGVVFGAGAGPGAVLISMLHDATTALSEFVQTAGAGAGLQDFFGLITTTGDTLGVLAGVLGPLFQGVFAVLGQLIPQVTTLQTALQPVVTALGEALGAALTGLAPALGAIIGLVVQIVQVIAPFVSILVGALGPAIARIGELFSQHLGPPLQDAITQLQPLFDLMLKVFGPQITGLINGLVEVIGGLFEILGGLITFLVGVFTGDWEKAWSGIESIFSGLVGIITGLLEVLLSRFGVNFDDIGSQVSNAWDSMVKFSTEAIGNIVSTVTRVLSNLPGVVRGAFETAVRFLATAFLRGIVQAQNIAGDIVDTVLDVIGGLNLFDAGQNILSSLAEGMINGLSSAFAVAESAAQGIRNFFPFSPAKTGPMSGRGSPDRAGEKIMSMLSDGIREGAYRPQNELESVLRPFGDIGTTGAGRGSGGGRPGNTLPTASASRNTCCCTDKLGPSRSAPVRPNRNRQDLDNLRTLRRGTRSLEEFRPLREVRRNRQPIPFPGSPQPPRGDAGNFMPPVQINQNYYGPTTSGGRARELEWAVQYSVPSRTRNAREEVFSR